MFALIAGTGRLPVVLFDRLSSQGKSPLVCALEGFDPELVPDVSFRLEHLGSFLIELRNRGIEQVCMAGAVRRPVVDPSEIDAATLPIVPRLQAALAKGDDGTLREIISLFEDHDISVVGASDIAPNLFLKHGVRTDVGPSKQHTIDANLGFEMLCKMGHADTGQACIVKDGIVTATEGPAGTDAMIADLKDSGGILFKGPKPNQDRRADLPVIGLQTANAVVNAGLDGIVIVSNGVMVLDQKETIQTLDAAQKFLWVRP